MISKHCGQRLVPVFSHSYGHRQGKHTWECKVCNRIFTQRTRKVRSVSVPEVRNVR